MKITQLEIENFKRIKAVSITPDGNVITLAGKNKQGKTSILDAIQAAFVGGDQSKFLPQPIREGEKYASVVATISDSDGNPEYIVTRRWFLNGRTTLTVESPRGAQYGSPQKVLDGIVGKRSMDIMQFIKQSPRDQVDTLVEMLGDTLGFDPVALEKERAEETELRKVANRDVKNLKARLGGIAEVPADTPDVEVSATDLLNEVQFIHTHNAGVDELERAAQAAAYRNVDAAGAVDRQREVLAEAEAHLTAAIKDDVEAQAAAAAAERRTDADVLTKLANIDVVNRNVRILADHTKLAAELTTAEAIAAEHDDALKAIATKQKDGLAAVVMPLDGLGFDESGVTFNGVALAQASGAEKRAVGFALAVALNPELRVVRIDEGEAFDSEGLAHIAELAEKYDTQVWMARVDESGTVGIEIEDGEVKA